ncbi:MAG: UDP-N-acetylmuramoyl-L-alanyl-D-glutamate--2,6-diaminopimelate ligase [Gammaproteobacteria bacterium]|nr:UDP-N-acetylmuramoyl-L-alanyl-D-glutamate--2,6-diaminopimelate ligase [Gammaproteobacteria bacterium]NNM14918.1 UDP-N-acetylmuramoyl-L-alanyl-D-glutamate--2,6-diaminopimelate ligase [Gammaproteobacteria bacterium]
MSAYLTTLGELLDGMHELDTGIQAIKVRGLALDSRRLQRDEVFIAVQGGAAHGLDFLDSILDKQVAAIIFEPSEQYPENFTSTVPMIAVEGLGQKVSDIAARFYAHPSEDLGVIAITGTNGKTTCAYLLTQLLTNLEKDAAMIGTLGAGRLDEIQESGLTTPDAISVQALLAEFRDRGIEYVVMEASSHALHQNRLAAVKIDVAAFTNLSQDHLDYHADMHAYLAAKAQLFNFPSLATGVLNADDKVFRKLQSLMPAKLKTINFSLQASGSATVSASAIQSDARKTEFTLSLNNKNYFVQSPLLGEFNVANLLLVISVMTALNFDPEAIVAQIKQLSAPKGRLQRMGNLETPTVVIDYAHTPDALEKALQTLKPLSQDKLAAVFGCGGDRDKSKRPVMGMIAANLADQIYLTDDNPRTETSEDIIADIQNGIREQIEVRIIPDRAKAIRQSIHAASAQDIVLIAGKGHETFQIIGSTKHDFSDELHAQSALDVWPELSA